MAPRLSEEELAAALGRQLGGTVRDLRRLSGGASRVTSAFDLLTAGGGTRPLILQMDRGASQKGRARLEGALLRAAAAAGVPVPAVIALGEGDELGANWMVVQRLEGETIPREDPARRGMGDGAPGPDRPGRPRAGRHPHHRSGAPRRAAGDGPTG